jgi:hypothetical protein
MSVYELNYITCVKVNFSTVCYEQSRKLHTRTHTTVVYRAEQRIRAIRVMRRSMRSPQPLRRAHAAPHHTIPDVTDRGERRDIDFLPIR